MTSPSSCVRCSKPLAILSPGGLCPECAATAATPEPTFLPNTPLGPAPSAPTGSVAPAGATLSADSGLGRNILPHAPAGYDLLDHLGAGGMGSVYLAREQATERLVAMKFLHQPGNLSAIDRFLVEVRLLARLDHPNIVRVLTPEFLRAEPFFTMEYMPGGSLSKLTSPDRPVSVPEAVRLIRVVADAIAAAHAQKVIHRDLKPSNILLTADGTPKVSDFGLAKRLDQDDGVTLGTAALGTPSYMPPEQISSKNGELGPWSDVYGLGATLYHLVTGRAPFVGETSEEIIPQVLADPPTRPRALRPDLPPALEGIVVKCLEKDPKDRYQSVPELAADLDRFTTPGQNPLAPPLTRWRRAKRWARRNRPWLAGTGAAVLLAVAMVWVGMAAAPVPKLPPDEPAVEPLQAVRNELASNQRSALLGESGRPRHERWLIGTANVIEPTDANPAFAFEAPEPTQLELLANPGVEHYRITAEFQLRYHKTIVTTGARQAVAALSPDTTLFGLYCGDVPLATADGHPVRLSLVATYTDFFSKEVRDKLPKLQGFAQLEAAAIVPGSDGALASRTAGAGDVYRFPPTDALPTPWRRIRIDISPAGVEMSWAASPTARWKLVGRRNQGDLTIDLNRRAEELGVNLAAHPPLTWNHAASCGIWCRGAAIAVRNVTVETPPYPPD